MPISKETYEKALRTIEDYKGRKPSELSGAEFAALNSATLIVRKYREENPER
jgi:hypothetical protein